MKLKELIDHLADKAEQRTGGDGRSLLLPREFLEYLKASVFTNFNLETGVVDLSRHSAAHGVAMGEDYTQVRALQTLLSLDQIYFYLPSPPNEAEQQ